MPFDLSEIGLPLAWNHTEVSHINVHCGAVEQMLYFSVLRLMGLSMWDSRLPELR